LNNSKGFFILFAFGT